MSAEAIAAPTFWAPGRKAVGVWLLCVALLITAMVVIGGLTRLTGSGLSITEWDPIMGAIPPLSVQDWQEAFAKYRQIPQYIHENQGMTLDAFKSIYWWEWTHRLLGRLTGAAFLLPFLFFAWRGAIGRKDIPRMVVLFLLGALQGFVGWWMVESGLEVRVSVSQYRLAIHLGVALILLLAILWTALEYLRASFPPPERGRVRAEGKRVGVLQSSRNDPFAIQPSPFRGGKSFAIAFVALVYAQMLLGALVAGLHAGLIYNTWPSMDGRVFPEGAFSSTPWWRNFFENPGLAQFDHRIGAYIVGFSALVLWIAGRRARVSGWAHTTGNLVLAIVAVQIALGVATLLNQAPVLLSALHQTTAVALLSAALWHAYELRGAAPAQSAAAFSA